MRTHAELKFAPRFFPVAHRRTRKAGAQRGDALLSRPLRRGAVQGRAGALGADVLRRPERPDLPGVEGAPAGSDNTVRAVDFADGEEPADVFGFPPDIPGEAAVVVLGADRDLQQLRREIDTVTMVKFQRRGVEATETLERRRRPRARILQVVARLRRQGGKFQIGGVGAVVEKHPAAALRRFAVDENVDQRRTRHMPRRKRPLVAFQEDRIVHRRRRGEVFAQKFALVRHPVRRGRHEAREDLHVTARDVPAELGRRQPELRFGEVARLRPDLKSQPDRPGMHRRVDALRVQPARTADREDHVLGGHGFEDVVRARGVQVDEHRSAAASAAVLIHGQKRHRDAPFDDFDAAPFHLDDKRPAHLARGVRSAARRPPFGVVVGLVADVFPVFVVRERHAERRKKTERLNRQRRLDEREVAVHRAPRGEVAREQDRRIGLKSVHSELVVGLLVAPRIDRGTSFEPLGVDRERSYPPGVEPHRRRETRGAASDDERMQFPYFRHVRHPIRNVLSSARRRC